MWYGHRPFFVPATQNEHKKVVFMQERQRYWLEHQTRILTQLEPLVADSRRLLEAAAVVESAVDARRSLQVRSLDLSFASTTASFLLHITGVRVQWGRSQPP
jgi:hypothetical protein